MAEVQQLGNIMYSNCHRRKIWFWKIEWNLKWDKPKKIQRLKTFLRETRKMREYFNVNLLSVFRQEINWKFALLSGNTENLRFFPQIA